MKYCEKCGKEILDEAVICPNCGCATGKYTEMLYTAGDIYTELSNKVKINGIIWICIAAVQLFAGIYFDWLLLIVGVLNLITAIQDIKFSSELLNRPSGVVAKYEPLTGPIIVLIYNLIFGGVIGVVGSIYYLVGIRKFVIGNKDKFSAEETAGNTK